MSSLLLKIDKSNLRQVILDFPKQFRIGINSAKKSLVGVRRPPIRFEKVIICGMGGSALAGNLLADLRLTKSQKSKVKSKKVSFTIHKDYGLPRETSKKSLVICNSFSGNTEETLDAYKEAGKRKLYVVAVTTGGALGRLARANRTPLILLPSLNLQPRHSIFMQFAALSILLTKYKILLDFEKDILKLEELLKPGRLEERGKRLAKLILGKIPLIYSSPENRSLAYNWKIRFNENAKNHAFLNTFPELDHNELVAYEKPRLQTISSKIFFAILLNDGRDRKEIQKRMRITARTIEGSVRGLEVIRLEGKSSLEKIFKNIILADWTAYWLALLRNVDPTPVKIIEELKEQMKKSR